MNLSDFNHRLNIQRNMRYGQLSSAVWCRKSQIRGFSIFVTLQIILLVTVITGRNQKRKDIYKVKKYTSQQRCRTNHSDIANWWQTVSFIKKPLCQTGGGGHTRYLSDHWGVSALSLGSVQQQHGPCSSRQPCTTRAEEEDTGDVFFTHSDSSLLLLLLLPLVIAGRESRAARRKENLQPALILPHIIL